MIEYRVLHIGRNILSTHGANFYDAVCFSIFLEVLEVGIGILVECLRHGGQQEGLVIHAGRHTHFIIYGHHLGQFSLSLFVGFCRLGIIVCLCVGIIFALVVLPVRADGGTTKLVARLAGESDTTGNMTHGKGNIMGRT